jgi:hypothetical protein
VHHFSGVTSARSALPASTISASAGATGQVAPGDLASVQHVGLCETTTISTCNRRAPRRRRRKGGLVALYFRTRPQGITSRILSARAQFPNTDLRAKNCMRIRLPNSSNLKSARSFVRLCAGLFFAKLPQFSDTMGVLVARAPRGVSNKVAACRRMRRRSGAVSYAVHQSAWRERLALLLNIGP